MLLRVKKNVLPIVKRLLEKDIIFLEEEIYEKYIPKKVQYVRLAAAVTADVELEAVLTTLDRAPKQKSVLLTLFKLQTKPSYKNKHLSIADLVKESNTSTAAVKALSNKGILEIYTEQVDRISYSKQREEGTQSLSPAQETALEEIRMAFKAKKVCLLHGVTASGKTEVYSKLIEDQINTGKQVLYLLPEIALTAQLITRLQQYFGKEVITYHSKFSANERVEIWNLVQSEKGSGKLIVGARSAVFLPFKNLGLVIVDEEHETTFKQFDPAPRYHARDAAIVLSRLFGADIVLGSATPSIESYHNTQQDKYRLVELKERFGAILMPEITLVNIKEKNFKKLMTGHFSDELIAEIQKSLDTGQQTILFQNRRGFAPITECTTCGHAPQCPNCDVSLTFHQYQNQLRCHYCGYHIAKLIVCMACGSTELTNKGFGTEQVEEELKELFPKAKIGRMDQDTTRGKHSHEKLIQSFENGTLDIMVGTQMLAKGLDFRNVNLVGVMNADSLLNFPDFRAHERSFQLLQQVSGRAGRTKDQGKVLIQTYNPYHQILQQVAANNYAQMYTDQREERLLYRYPPFFRLIKITFRHKDYNRTNLASEWFFTSLRNVFLDNVLGPESPPVARIRNQYYKNILLKIPQQQSIDKTKKIVYKIRKTFSSIKDFSGVRVVMDVDNY